MRGSECARTGERVCVRALPSRPRLPPSPAARSSSYVSNTHGPTHTAFSLEVEEVFRVERAGEAARFEAFTTQHAIGNRQLLWHGCVCV